MCRKAIINQSTLLLQRAAGSPTFLVQYAAGINLTLMICSAGIPVFLVQYAAGMDLALMLHAAGIHTFLLQRSAYSHVFVYVGHRWFSSDASSISARTKWSGSVYPSECPHQEAA